MSFLSRSLRTPILWTGLALALPLPLAASPGDGCTDERATEVEASVKESPEVDTCGTGLVAFGFTIGFGGERCPDWRISMPAHQTCEGESLAGHRCVESEDLPVRFETCDCERLTVPFLEIGVAGPICDCDLAANLGHVEDFATEVCPPDDPSDGPAGG